MNLKFSNPVNTNLVTLTKEEVIQHLTEHYSCVLPDIVNDLLGPHDDKDVTLSIIMDAKDLHNWDIDRLCHNWVEFIGQYFFDTNQEVDEVVVIVKETEGTVEKRWLDCRSNWANV